MRNYVNDDEIPDYKISNKFFRQVLIQVEGTIEDCNGAMQVWLFRFKDFNLNVLKNLKKIL